MEETERERQEREKKESQTWDEQIQPILDNCKDSVQGYRCYKLEYSVSNRQLYMIERLMDAQCNSLNEVSERRLVHHRETTFLDLLEYLHDRRPEEIRSGYKDVFWRFFKILHDKKLLPYFLEYLRRHPLPWAGKHSNQDLERQIDELLRIARPQVDILEEARRRTRQLRDDNLRDIRAKRKADVLAEFEARKSELHLIKKKWLEADELYKGDEKPKRTFIGLLLKKIAHTRHIPCNDAQKLFYASQKHSNS